MKQSQRGKAFEYALALQFSEVLNIPLIGPAMEYAKQCYQMCDQRESMIIAAREAALFLDAYDTNLRQATSIRLQSDSAGQTGDVRDLLLETFKGDIGISAKTNHYAIKHSRLSDRIDFGLQWADYPVSSRYWTAISPTFQQMMQWRDSGMMFRDIPNKDAVVYLPILIAFEDEFRRLCENFGQDFISKVFRYLIGKHDFYKVIKERKSVLIQSFNLTGTLEWGKRWTVPNEIEQIRRPAGFNNKLLITFTGGWQLSFRLHNARSQVEPSLKFDINFIGIPVYAAGNQIPLSN